MANVELKWAKEVKHFCGKNCPIILVANKIDIRTDQELIKELEKDHIVRNFINYRSRALKSRSKLRAALS